jgi:hypothetical protein
MRKNTDSSSSKKCFDGAVLESLSTIREAHVQLRLLTGTSATAALLASQIQLYNFLLDEISGIHASLARDLKRSRLKQKVSSRSSCERVSRLN